MALDLMVNRLRSSRVHERLAVERCRLQCKIRILAVLNYVAGVRESDLPDRTAIPCSDNVEKAGGVMQLPL